MPMSSDEMAEAFVRNLNGNAKKSDAEREEAEAAAKRLRILPKEEKEAVLKILKEARAVRAQAVVNASTEDQRAYYQHQSWHAEHLISMFEKSSAIAVEQDEHAVNAPLRTLNLKQLAKELINDGQHRGGSETVADNEVIEAVNRTDGDLASRKKRLVSWLNRYKVFMGYQAADRLAVADQVIAFADERLEKSLGLDRVRIVAEFDKLKDRIATVTPRGVTSLTSKALWCCYPNDVPIFDSYAAYALKVISRICRLAPEPCQGEYACFVDLWLQVYREIEPVINADDLTDCPYKVRVLDRLLWYLGQ